MTDEETAALIHALASIITLQKDPHPPSYETILKILNDPLIFSCNI